MMWRRPILVLPLAVKCQMPLSPLIDSHSPRKTCCIFARSSNASFTVCASVQSKVGKVGFGPSR